MRFFGILLLLVACSAQADETGLPVEVRAALDNRHISHDTLSVFVMDVETGATVLEWRADEPRNPASTIKLLTTLVALDVLGPAYRWRTDVYAKGEIRDGRLDGDLLIKGFGDPFLVTERVWQLLREIRHAGIREITGDLLLDDSWFEVGNDDPAAFDHQPLRAYNVAPNALLMNFKVVRYWFEPDDLAGAVNIRLDPPLDELRIDNELKLAAGGCRGYQRGIAMTANDRVDKITFSGYFPDGCERYTMDRVALSHNAYAHGLFRYLWRESGGAFDGGWRNVVAEDGAEPIVSFKSLPLGEMIARVNKHSNNVMARQLLYTLGAETNGAPGTEDSGKAVISRWLADNGLESRKTAIQNGAGLSRNTRITAKNMGALLHFAWQQPYMPEYLASLSISGLDGTLKGRFSDTVLVGKAHLKTGSLDHVTAIAGYLQSRSGRRFVIVAMQSDTDIHRGPGEELQEALLRWLYDQ